MADERAEPGERSSDGPPQQPPGRVTPLGWVLIAACPLLVAILFIAARGPVAVIAFLLLALDVAVLGAALIAPPRRQRQRRPWRP